MSRVRTIGKNWRWRTHGTRQAKLNALSDGLSNAAMQRETAQKLWEAFVKSPNNTLATADHIFAAINLLEIDFADEQQRQKLLRAFKANPILRIELVKKYAITTYEQKENEEIKDKDAFDVQELPAELVRLGRQKLEAFLESDASNEAYEILVRQSEIADLLSDEELVRLALENHGAAVAIFNDPKLSLRAASQITPEQIATLLRKDPVATDEKWQHYFPIILAFLLKHCANNFEVFWQDEENKDLVRCKLLAENLPEQRPDVVNQIKKYPKAFLTLADGNVESLIKLLMHANQPIALLKTIIANDKDGSFSEFIRVNAINFVVTLKAELKKKDQRKSQYKKDLEELLKLNLQPKQSIQKTVAAAIKANLSYIATTVPQSLEKTHQYLQNIAPIFEDAYLSKRINVKNKAVWSSAISDYIFTLLNITSNKIEELEEKIAHATAADAARKLFFLFSNPNLYGWRDGVLTGDFPVDSQKPWLQLLSTYLKPRLEIQLRKKIEIDLNTIHDDSLQIQLDTENSISRINTQANSQTLAVTQYIYEAYTSKYEKDDAGRYVKSDENAEALSYEMAFLLKKDAKKYAQFKQKPRIIDRILKRLFGYMTNNMRQIERNQETVKLIKQILKENKNAQANREAELVQSTQATIDAAREFLRQELTQLKANINNSFASSPLLELIAHVKELKERAVVLKNNELVGSLEATLTVLLSIQQKLQTNYGDLQIEELQILRANFEEQTKIDVKKINTYVDDTETEILKAEITQLKEQEVASWKQQHGEVLISLKEQTDLLEAVAKIQDHQEAQLATQNSLGLIIELSGEALEQDHILMSLSELKAHKDFCLQQITGFKSLSDDFDAYHQIISNITTLSLDKFEVEFLQGLKKLEEINQFVRNAMRAVVPATQEKLKSCHVQGEKLADKIQALIQAKQLVAVKDETAVLRKELATIVENSGELQAKVTEELLQEIARIRSDVKLSADSLTQLIQQANDLNATDESNKLQMLLQDLQKDIQVMSLEELLEYKKQTCDFALDNIFEITQSLESIELQKRKKEVLSFKKSLRSSLDELNALLEKLTAEVVLMKFESVDLNSLAPLFETLQQELQMNEQAMSLDELRTYSEQTCNNWQVQVDSLRLKLTEYQSAVDEEILSLRTNLKAQCLNLATDFNKTSQFLLDLKNNSSSYAFDATVQKINLLLENIQQSKETLLSEIDINDLNLEQLLKSPTELIAVLNEKIKLATQKIETVTIELEDQKPKMGFATPEKSHLPKMSAATPNEEDNIITMGMASPVSFVQPMMAAASPVSLTTASTTTSGMAAASPEALTFSSVIGMADASPVSGSLSTGMAAVSPVSLVTASTATSSMAAASPEASTTSSVIGMAAASPVSGSSTMSMATASPVSGSSAMGMASASPISGSSTMGMATASPVLGSSSMATASPVSGSSTMGMASASPVLGNPSTGMAAASPILGSSSTAMASASPVLGSASIGMAPESPILGSSSIAMASASPVLGSASIGMAPESPILSSSSTAMAPASPVLGSASIGMAPESPILSSSTTAMASVSPLLGSASIGMAPESPLLSSSSTQMASASPVLGSSSTGMAVASPVLGSTSIGIAPESPVIKEISPTGMAAASPLLSSTSIGIAPESPVVKEISPTGMAAVSPVLGSLATGMAAASPVAMESASPLLPTAWPIEEEDSLLSESALSENTDLDGESATISSDSDSSAPRMGDASPKSSESELTVVYPVVSSSPSSFWSISDTPKNRKGMPLPSTPYEAPATLLK